MIILASLAEIEAARANGCESRGPGTAAGLARSSMNAFKHGRRSKKMARLDEDSIQFEIRHQSWLARLNPRGDVEEFLTEHIAVMACELDRAKKAHLDHLARLVEDSDERDVDAVHELGKKLYFDPCGLYGFAADNCKKHTSWNGTIGGEFDPDTLVRRLAKSAPGCLFLRDEWKALRGLLAPGKFWQSSHRLKATRLLGRQPVDALVDRDVALIFIASRDPRAENERAFSELVSDVTKRGLNRFRRQARAAWPELFGADESVNYRAMLIELVDRQIERWDAEFAGHEENAGEEVRRDIDRLGVDRAKEGTLVREYYLKCWRLLQRGIANYEKLTGRGVTRKGGGEWSREADVDCERHPVPARERRSRVAGAVLAAEPEQPPE